MRIALKYGDREHSLSILGKAEVSVLRPAGLPTLESIDDAMKHALDNPLGCDRIEELARRKNPKNVTVAVPDESRSAPVKALLPILLGRLYSALPGLDPSSITIIIGGGLHPSPDREGMQKIVPPEIASGCRVIAHDALRARMVDFGVTRRGTPVKVNAAIAEADLKIVIGQIDPHQFVGFTGGAKGAVIGCGSAESIEHNHSLMSAEMAEVGRLLGNPAREDMNEAGRMLEIDMAIDVVVDADNNVVELLAGDPVAVLEKGAGTCAALYGLAIKDKFDIVVASCGGHPKDMSLYQAQKGLNLASYAAKQGGKILLLAACPQGAGDDNYFDYVCRFAEPEAVLEDFKRLGFKMGAHKAYLFARTLTAFDVAVCSDLDADVLKKCHLRAADPDSVIEKWVAAFEGRPRVAVIPNANTTYFYRA